MQIRFVRVTGEKPSARHAPGGFSLVRDVVVLGVVLLVVGCKSSGTSSKPKNKSAPTSASQVIPSAARTKAMAIADGYTVVIAQAMDQLAASTKRPEVAQFAKQQRVAAAMVSYSNATGPNDVACLIDMLALISLRRQATEKHWIPTLLHEEGQPVLEMERKAEQDAWSAAEKVLTADQLTELRGLIDEWVREHPDQYYVAYVRFADIAAEKQKSGLNLKAPSSLFSLLYLDPLSGLDPVAQELASFRAMSERLIFLSTRMSTVLSWQIDQRIDNATTSPEVKRFVDNTQAFADATIKFAGHTGRFADAAVKYPKDIHAERVAAIDQINAAVTTQREAVIKELDAREGQLRKIIADVNGLVDRVDRAGSSINESSRKTVTMTEESAARLVHRIFVNALILILVVLLGVPAAFLWYRRSQHRLLTSSGGGGA